MMKSLLLLSLLFANLLVPRGEELPLDYSDLVSIDSEHGIFPLSRQDISKLIVQSDSQSSSFLIPELPFALNPGLSLFQLNFYLLVSPLHFLSSPELPRGPPFFLKLV